VSKEFYNFLIRLKVDSDIFYSLFLFSIFYKSDGESGLSASIGKIFGWLLSNSDTISEIKVFSLFSSCYKNFYC